MTSDTATPTARLTLSEQFDASSLSYPLPTTSFDRPFSDPIREWETQMWEKTVAALEEPHPIDEFLKTST